MRKNKAKCEVCFFNQFTGPQNSQVIVCKGCKREAHRFCYLPQCEDKFFHCDACQSKIKNPQCIICHNEGLLKRTHEGQFGHPICLMLSKQSLVKNYQKLSFYYLKNKKKVKLFKCDICGKNSSLTELTKCFDGHCPCVAHFYCILKQQWKDNQQGNKWVQNLKLFESSYLNSLEYFQSKVKSFIHKFPNAIYKLIFDQKKLVEITPNYIVYCRKHSECLSNCYCETLDEPNAKVDWVYCDSCGKWYHFQCQSIDVDQAIQQEYYTCKCCQQWRAVIHKKQQPVVIFYPKMHFFDLVYIQNYAENMGYKVSQVMMELIKRVPFLCSVRYFNQIMKDKDIVSKIIKKTNFLPLKTMLVEKVSSKKQLTKILERLNKPLIDTLWKMDFLTCLDPIESIIKNKKGDYKLQQIISILQRYNKRYSTGLNLIKPAIKQLSKYQQQKYEHEDSQAENEQSNMLQGCITVLRQQLKEMKKINPNNKSNQIILINYYKAINQNQVLKQIVKNYIEQNKVLSELLEPLFIYQLESDMFHHTKFNFVFQKLIGNYERGDKMKNIYRLGDYCKKVYENCPSKVQIKNKKTMRELMLHNKNQYQVVNEKYIIIQSSIHKTQQKKEDQRNIHNIFELNGIKHSSRDLFQIEAYLQNQYKQQLVEYIFKNLDLKSSALNYLYLQYSKMSEIIRKNDQFCYKPYIKTYQASKTLIEAICQGANFENQLNDVDMLVLIKKLKIDRQNINRFCVYFNQICQLSLSRLKPDIPKMIQQKGLQLINYISQRSMIFQCEQQFKAVSSLMRKFKYKKQEKIQELINRNKQLVEMLRKFSFDSLQSLQLMESNIKILKQAKQYCQQNNLEFRISKIEYALRLFQIKQESFKYFPAEFIVKNTEKLPKKFTNIEKITSIDYCLLKKFMYKMKVIKFPVTDHLYIKVNDLYTSRTDYFNILSSIITYYNCLTFKETITAQYPKFKKTEVQYLISSTSQSFVTCQPQQQEIFIIFALYDKVLQKINNILKNDELDIDYCNKVQKQFLKFPFQIEQNSEFKILCDRITRFKNKQIKVQVETSSCVNVECLSVNKKGFQQQTSQKQQFMDKETKNAYNFITQIQNRPRNLTIEDIKKRMTQISNKNVQSNINVHLNKMTEVANAIIQSNTHLIAKLNKGDPLTQFDNIKAKKMIEEYQKQPLRIEIIEKIIRYIRGVDSFLVTNLEESKRATDFQASSFRSSSSQLSRQNGRSSSKSSQKVKKTKIVLRK